MAQLRQSADQLAILDIEVLIVGPEKAESFRKYWEKESLPFIGLPNPDHSVMKLYEQEWKLLKLGRMPAQMLIDKSGIVKFVYYGKSMADVPDPGDVVNVVSAW